MQMSAVRVPARHQKREVSVRKQVCTIDRTYVRTALQPFSSPISVLIHNDSIRIILPLYMHYLNGLKYHILPHLASFLYIAYRQSRKPSHSQW